MFLMSDQLATENKKNANTLETVDGNDCPNEFGQHRGDI